MPIPFNDEPAATPHSVFGNYATTQCEEPPFELVQGAATQRDDSERRLQQRIDAAVARSFLHRLLAKCFEYPDVESWGWLLSNEVRTATVMAAAVLDGDALRKTAETFLCELSTTDFDAFLSDHLASFGHAARGPNPMNEIEYGELKADPLFQPHRLADLAAFYRAFGMELAADAGERLDHISVELEFMSLLAAKEAYAIEHQHDDEMLDLVRFAQKKFLREHLGRWTPAFARRLARAAASSAVVALANLTREFVIADCELFAVAAGSEELVLRPIDESAESLCASCGVNSLPPGALPTS